MRLNVSSAAESFLSGPVLPGFLRAYPRIQLDLVVSEHTGEIVAAGYDAAIGLREVIERDMIAIRFSEDMRLLVVGAPAYFECRPVPDYRATSPSTSASTGGLGRKRLPTAGSSPRTIAIFSVAVEARVVTTDPRLNLRLAVAGVGLNMAWETWAREHIDNGELVAVLEEYCLPLPASTSISARRHRPAALRALIDYRRSKRGG